MGHQSRQRRLLFLTTGAVVLLLLGQMVVSSSGWLNRPFPGFFVYQNLTVSPYSLPGWSGAAAGLRSLDRIIGFNGEPITNRTDFYARVHSLPADVPVRYQISRADQRLDVVVRTQTFALRDYVLSFGIYVLIGLAFLIIGALPYFYRTPSPVALPLCFMVMTVFLWFETTFDFVTEGSLPKEIRIFALCLTPSAAIHLALMLRQSAVYRRAFWLTVSLLYTLGTALGILNVFTYFGPVEIWRQCFRAAYIYVLLGASAFLLIIASALRSTPSDLERSRLRVMLAGAIVGFLVPAAATVLGSWFQWEIPYNLALVPTVFFPISVAYALLKYRLFDLGQALKLAVSRIALLGLLVGIYAAIAITIAPWARESARDPLVVIFFSLLVIVLFNPLLRRLEKVIDRYVYRLEYDPPKLQSQVSMFLRTLDSPSKIASGFIDRLAGPLGIDRAGLFYRTNASTAWLSVASGNDEAFNQSANLEAGFPLDFWRGTEFGPIYRAEVPFDPRFDACRTELLQFYERFQAELLLPLVYDHEVRGFLCFGAKRAGFEYSSEDFRLLNTLAEQLCLSLENGRLYEEALTERQKAESSNQKLHEADRLKKDFVANICHEIRTPVSAMIGYAEVLRNPSSTEESRMHLNRLVDNGQELTRLMDNLMDYSRLEADGSATHFEMVNLNEMVGGLAIMTQRLIRARPIEFGVSMDSAIAEIETDGQKLQQILIELLTNALKFTKKGRVDLSVRADHEHGAIEMTVADTGIGIRSEDQELIFEDFRQLDGSSTRHYGGTGVGLGLCRKYAAALGGEIRLTSEVDVGSVFKLRLPWSAVETPILRHAA
jgi:signal transduction histidine kinase